VVNARDAMNAVQRPGFKKKLTIETGKAYLNKDYVAKYPGTSEGLFVYFSVSDNGIGMDEKTKEKIFEPFFTTKEKHRGTGLGLSVIYGIVQQNHGVINVYSEPGQGAVFQIYWPVTEEMEEVKETEQADHHVLHGNEQILIVEDDEQVREVTKMALTSLGYVTHEASDGTEALEMLQNGLEVDLILTDLIMPNMTGREFAQKAKEQFGCKKIIFVSGYTGDHISHNGMLERDINFLAKPYSLKDLSLIVRKVLDEE
jgi:CheY-like chemotaxis protein